MCDKIIDLCSGCGGMSLGFKMTGFEPILAIEKDVWASETYHYNFPNVKLIVDDITQIINLSELGLDNVEIDGILSGSPCQSFSLRDKNDPRNSLFMDFIRFTKYFKPKFCLMETNTGILSMKTLKGEKVKKMIIEEIEKVGYNVKVYRLNAVDFGVPQSRLSVFFIGFRNDLNIKDFEINSIRTQDEYVTVAEAIMDLPQIKAREGTDEMDYIEDALTTYQKLMRVYSDKVYNHITINHSNRLIERYKRIGVGQTLNDYGQSKTVEMLKLIGKERYKNYRPYPDKPSPSIPLKYPSSFIHPYLDRNFTPREVARLHSFPDDFIFKGKRMTMSWEKNLNQFYQIGNAVPPLLAKSIAEQIKAVILSQQVTDF